MYLLKNGYLKQENIIFEFTGKPGMKQGILWLNPPFIKCRAAESAVRKPG